MPPPASKMSWRSARGRCDPIPIGYQAATSCPCLDGMQLFLEIFGLICRRGRQRDQLQLRLQQVEDTLAERTRQLDQLEVCACERMSKRAKDRGRMADGEGLCMCAFVCVHAYVMCLCVCLCDTVMSVCVQSQSSTPHLLLSHPAHCDLTLTFSHKYTAHALSRPVFTTALTL